MPDTKKEMKSKHIPVVCTKAMEQFLAVSPERDLISLWLKPFRVFICTLAPEVYELIGMPIKHCEFSQRAFLGDTVASCQYFLPHICTDIYQNVTLLSR